MSGFGFRETGVWIWFLETGVRKQVSDFLGGKQVSGNRCLDMAPGNRCWETGVLIPVGNRCRETAVLIPVGNRCRETGVLIPLGNRCRETGVLKSIVWKQMSLAIWETHVTGIYLSKVGGKLWYKVSRVCKQVSGYRRLDNSCLGNR